MAGVEALTGDAVAEARRVVGLYGDPTVSWSILLEATLREPAEPEAVRRRLAAAVAAYPHLGDPPDVLTPEDWTLARAEFADRRYAARQPLIRVAVSARPARLLIAAHHGAVDGFGLLALIGLALDAPMRSQAPGLGERPARRGFVTSAGLRLAEALWAPPSRAAARGGHAGLGGDALRAVELSASRLGSAALVAATARTVRRWNHRRRAPSGRIVAAVGASRRPGDELAPDRRTAFLRLRLGRRGDVDELRRLLAETAPEPDFPASDSPLARLAIRALSPRLGATFLASNLGVVNCAGVGSLAFYPTASGRNGVAVGAVTCGGATMVTLRARRAGFDEAAADELLALLTEEVSR